MFSNPDIALDALPNLEEPAWRPMDPRFVRRLQLDRLILLAIPTIALLAGKLLLPIPLATVLAAACVLLIVAALLLYWPVIAVPRRGYVVRDKDLVFRSGVIWQSVTAVPFNRIQHVETSSTPLDRRYELATLQIFTAGGAGGDLKIDGLNRAEAEKLRAFLLAKAGSSIEHT